MGENPYLVDLTDGIKTITFNQPERRNPINPVMARELIEHVNNSMEDGTRVIIFTGAGGYFSSGADLANTEDPQTPPDPGIKTDKTFHNLIRAITSIELPVIAAVDGIAVGYGLSLAAACDMLFASERARFSVIFVQRALIPDGGATWTLPRIIGLRKAMELACTAEIFDVEKADKLGLVNRIYPHEELMEETRKFAAELARGPVRVMGSAKRIFYESQYMDVDKALTNEALVQGDHIRHPDFAEGVSAFFEKREPKFS